MTTAENLTPGHDQVTPTQPASKSTPGRQENADTAQAPSQVTWDDSRLQTMYANFCRVTGTPEELIVDFGMNAQPSARQGADQVELNQRIVLNFYTAKRLLSALHMAVQRHETIFGELETNVQKRVKLPASANGDGS